MRFKFQFVFGRFWRFKVLFQGMSPNFDKFKVRYWIANLTKLHNFSCLISISSLCSKFESSSDYSNFESVILKSVEIESVRVDRHPCQVWEQETIVQFCISKQYLCGQDSPPINEDIGNLGKIIKNLVKIQRVSICVLGWFHFLDNQSHGTETVLKCYFYGKVKGNGSSSREHHTTRYLCRQVVGRYVQVENELCLSMSAFNRNKRVYIPTRLEYLDDGVNSLLS